MCIVYTPSLRVLLLAPLEKESNTDQALNKHFLKLSWNRRAIKILLITMFCIYWIFTVTEKSLRQFQIWTQRNFLKFPRSVRLKTIFLGISSISRIKPIQRLLSQLRQTANRNSAARQPHGRENAAKAPSGPGLPDPPGQAGRGTWTTGRPRPQSF